MKQWHKTNFRGVRYRKHPKRKYGVKFDQYFTIRYQQDGERKEEGLGWASEGWSAAKAALTLANLKIAAKTGVGPSRLSEQREIAKKKREAEAHKRITVNTFFKKAYYPEAQSVKDPKTYKHEFGLYNNWIKSTIGSLRLNDVAPIHLEKIRTDMSMVDRSPRTILYALGLVRQIFNSAYRHGVFSGVNPIKKIKLPRSPANHRLRFLSPDEADKLLGKLIKENRDVYGMALISLHCGLRASEIFRLRWVDIDLSNRLLTIKRSKNKRTRVAYIR